MGMNKKSLWIVIVVIFFAFRGRAIAVNKFEIQAKIIETKQKKIEIEEAKKDKLKALMEVNEDIKTKKDLATKIRKQLGEYDEHFYKKVLLYNTDNLSLDTGDRLLLDYDIKIERLKYAFRIFFYEAKKRDTIDKIAWRNIVKNDLNHSIIGRAQLLWDNPGLKHNGLDMAYDAVYNEKENLLSEKNNTEIESGVVQSEKNELTKEISEIERRAEQYARELDQFEGTLKAIIDYKVLPPKGTVVFAWPTSETYITQKFGLTADSKNLYQSGKHNGTDFRAKYEPVYAMDDAVVEGIGDTDLTCPGASFGKWVFLYHPTHLATAYGHLSKIYVKKGQYIKKGEIIGVSGNSGHTTGPHLHVSVFAGIDSSGNKIVSINGKESNSCGGKLLFQPRAPKNAYLNPLDYLPPVPKKEFFGGSHHD